MAERHSKPNATPSASPMAEELRIPAQKRCRSHDTLAEDPDGLPSA
jgi:hypothetical protein